MPEGSYRRFNGDGSPTREIACKNPTMVHIRT
jgi:hypothetical protein